MTEQMKQALDKAAERLQWSSGDMLIDKETLKPADLAVAPLERLVHLPVPNLIDNAVHFGANWYRNNVWHERMEEPEERAHCLIRFDCSSKPISYLNFELVFYNKTGKKFVTEVYPHPTGYNIEKSTLEGGVMTEVHKNRRDYIPISDIHSWAYLEDLLPTEGYKEL